MPNNYPYDRWYWNDWFASTAILSATARGVWISLLAHMYLTDRTYFFVGTEAELARISGCDADTVRSVVQELHRHKIADVNFHYENVTDLLRIECRRYKKAYDERKRASEGMKKLRDERKGYADVTSTRARIQYPISNIQEKVSTDVDMKKTPDPGSVKHFVKPSVDDVAAYCSERKNGIDAQRFWNYYESKGWVVGRSPMKDWKACVRTWEKNEQEREVRPASSWQGKTSEMEETDINGEGFLGNGF